MSGGSTSAERLRGADGIPLVWEPGDVILDLYEVRPFSDTTPFIEGGMGRVNRVWHRQWQTHLAVKSVHPNRLKSTQAVDDFKREAEEWVNRIGLHPHVVFCHYVRILGGLPRLFVEFVEGGSLKHWIAEGGLYAEGPERALERLLDVAIQLAWGLHYVHELGLIHQDVKPDNVLLTADGLAKLTDFGMARARAAAAEDTASGNPGQTLRLAAAGFFTREYASPEQLGKESLTRRTDVWSWAVSVLHMFVRTLPPRFVGPGAPLLLRSYLGAGDPEEGLPALPGELAELLLDCFHRSPEERPHDMLQVADALQKIYFRVTGSPYPRESPRASDLLADTLNNRAVSLFDLGKREDAKQKWQEALRVDLHHPEATYNWGLNQWRSARITDQKLLESLREVCASSADSARVDYLIGLIHLERADVQEAIQVLTKALEVGTGRAAITSALALAKSLVSPSEHLQRWFEGDPGHVNSVSWSPDGRYVLSGGGTGGLNSTLHVWEVSSGRCVRTLEDPTVQVTSVAWSPDGRYALSGSVEGPLRLWELPNGRCLHTFEGHTERVPSVWWSPDSRYALSGGWDGTLRLWEVSSGRNLRTFAGHTGWGGVSSVSWSPDGCYALSGGGDGTLRLWDVSSGECLRTFAGHTGLGGVSSVAWSPDGRYALSGGGTLRLWEVSSGRCLRTFEGHTGGVSSVSWSPDGRYALSGGGDGTLRLWEMSSGRNLRTFAGHTGLGGVSSVAWSPDGRYALSGGGDKTLRLWGIRVAKQSVALVTSQAFPGSSARYHRLLQQARDALSSNPAVAAEILQQARQEPGCSRRPECLDLARKLCHVLSHRSFVQGWIRRTVKEPVGKGVTSVSWSPDGRYALAGSGNYPVRMWEVFKGVCLRTFGGEGNSVAWSPDGRYALSGGEGRTLRLWEVSSGECLRTFGGHTGDVMSVSWSPDGRYALSGAWSIDFSNFRSGGRLGEMLLWEVSSGKFLRSFDGHAEPPSSVSWSPDARYALSGSMDKTLRLWEVSSGRCLRIFEGHTGGVSSVSWSPDGRYALSGGWDGTLRLWEVSSGECLRTFEGGWNSVAWSPDGRYALSGGGTLRLWEVSSGRCLRTFEGHTGGVSSVSWSPDGRYALSGGGDGTLRLWELDWELELNQPADWNEGARPFLNVFLTLHTPYADGMLRRGKPTWTEDDFRRLLDRLGCAGYGWLRTEGVRRELEQMAATWQGPPPLV